jgi:DNA mismatch repair protein MutS
MSNTSARNNLKPVLPLPGSAGIPGVPDIPASQLTPMLRQYLAVKAQHPDALVLFRMGDFYELFFQDAVIAARALDLTLTSRSGDIEKDPMAGVPHHAVKSYLARLIDQGYRVALCDQMEDPAQAKGIVRREVTRVVTPGMVVDEEALEARAFNFLVAVRLQAGGAESTGLSALDLSTGEFAASDYPATAEDQIVGELTRLAPRELIYPASEEAGVKRLATLAGLDPCFTPLEDNLFAIDGAEAVITAKLKGSIGTGPLGAGFGAARAVLAYVERTQKRAAPHIDRLAPLASGQYLLLDESAQRHLELVRSSADGKRKGSLLGVLDETRTTMGSRRLARWVLQPLAMLEPILERQAAVRFFFEDVARHEALAEGLKGVGDIERLVARVAMQLASPRDLGALRDSLIAAQSLRGFFDDVAEPLPPWIAERIAATHIDEGLVALLAGALADAPPLTVADGGIFRRGYHAALDELTDLAEHGQDKMLEVEARERAQTGINSLKVRYNRVFGYYFEITKANLASVPAHFIRRQTTVNGERYITPELKELEDKVLTARDNRLKLEADLFTALRADVAQHTASLREAAAAIAEIDAAQALAHVARHRRYVRPELHDGSEIEVTAGRHPVIESLSNSLGEPFVPNDMVIGAPGRRMLLITGPNMAGKSTLMRQAALIVLLAQMGGYVPADSARIGLVDRLFTRVGASDSLTRGQSTFMVEMLETASILHHATDRSLLILDEIGRGTSTFDGLSIAWAVAEYIHDRIRARTLFATHYHELTELADSKADAVNCRVDVREWNGQVIFLRKLVEGGANRSYGIQVAKLAGLPEGVLKRAKDVLAQLESSGLATGNKLGGGGGNGLGGRQLSLFVPVVAGGAAALDPATREALNKLRALEPEKLSPIDAWNELSNIVAELKKQSG